MALGPKPIDLKPETLAAYAAYVAEAEYVLDAGMPFLASDRSAEHAKNVNSGKVLVHPGGSKPTVHVPDGMIHDWLAAVRIEAATIDRVLALVQDYDRHKNTYRPDVMDSKLVSRAGDDFEIYLRLLKKKIITVVLDTWHVVHYGCRDPARWYCRSSTTRISEIEDAGTAAEMARLPDSGYGFLWRMYSNWRFEERAGGVIVECRSISLTRDIPAGLGWIVAPMVTRLPRESLIATLESTRRAVLTELRAPVQAH